MVRKTCQHARDHTLSPEYAVKVENLISIYIREVYISGKDEVRRHLNELGLVDGEYVTVIQNNKGNIIMQVRDGRIALDEKMAMRILF